MNATALLYTGTLDTDLYTDSSATWMELREHLNDLMDDAQGQPAMRARIRRLIGWVDDHMPVLLDDDEHTLNLDTAPAATNEYAALLIAQAQQQNQQ